MAQSINFAGIGGRFLASLVLVAATYNPTGHSFVHWIAATLPHIEPLQALAGIALLGLWIFFVGATWRSLGTIGVLLGLAIFAALIWVLISFGWLNLTNPGAVTWAAILIVACLLTVGLCWALVEARVTGQSVVEEVRR